MFILKNFIFNLHVSHRPIPAMKHNFTSNARLFNPNVNYANSDVSSEAESSDSSSDSDTESDVTI